MQDADTQDEHATIVLGTIGFADLCSRQWGKSFLTPQATLYRFGDHAFTVGTLVTAQLRKPCQRGYHFRKLHFCLASRTGRWTGIFHDASAFVSR